MAREEPCPDVLQSKLQRKESKLRRAVTFFKHLGLRSCSRHKSSGSSAVPETESFVTRLAGQKPPFEMEDKFRKTSYPMELSDTDRDTHRHRFSFERQSKAVYELESWDLEDLPRYEHEAAADVEPCELDVGSLVVASLSNGAAGKTRVSLTSIGAQFEEAQHDAVPRKEMLVSPVSISQSPIIGQSTGVDTSIQAELVSPIYNTDRIPSAEVVDHDWRQTKVTPTFSQSPLSSKNDGSICDGETLSTQSQVQELREMVRVLNEEWVRRCQSAPYLALRASALSPRSLFEKGAQVLQHVLRGALPRSFEAVFALAHVACASAYILHGDDKSHCWNEYFQDILKWQRLIPNESDARLFIHLLNLLWWPQGSSARLSCGNYFLDETSGTLVPLRSSAIGIDASGSKETSDSKQRIRPVKSASKSLLDSLKNGPVLLECLRFLDGIEYASIMDRSKQYPTHLRWYAENHVTNIEEMLKTIIHPLQSCDGFEALRGSIHFTASELRDGSLRSVREVEVSLISNGKSSCLSPQVYKRYLDAVTSVCDRAMHRAGLDWRDRCYALHLDMVLASVMEIDTQQRLKDIVPHHQQITSVILMPDTKQKVIESIRAPSSTESETLIGSSPSTTMSPTFTSGFSPTTQPSSVTSPETSFSASSPSSSNDVTHCPLCTAIFTGSLRDRSSNLRRHMRTTRNHGSIVGLLCNVPGCNAVISRSDNLGKHIRTVHEGDTSTTLRRPSARKRRRDGDTVE